jgi:hypothetical protein
LNSSRRGGKPATNRLSYGAALHKMLLSFLHEMANHFTFPSVSSITGGKYKIHIIAGMYWLRNMPHPSLT